MDVTIEEKHIPKKFNSRELAAEVAAALGVEAERVAVSYASAGSLVREVNGVITEEPRPAVMLIHVPEDSKVAKVLEAVKAHAPQMDDHEATAAREARRLETEVMALPAVKSLLADLQALKARGG